MLHLSDAPADSDSWLKLVDDATTGITIEISENDDGLISQAKFLLTVGEAKTLMAALQLAVTEGESL